MPNIVFIRPCECQFQNQGKLVGRKDYDLSQDGHKQARALAEYLASWPIGHIAVSPMKRALSTALYLCEENNRIPQIVPGFEGTDLGDWEGQTRKDVVQRDGARFDRWRQEPDFPCPGGESLRNIYRRSFNHLVELVHQAEANEVLLIIAPATIIKVLTCGILDIPLANAMSFDLNHGGISTFSRMVPKGAYQMSRWNDVGYQFEPMLEVGSLDHKEL